MKIKIGALKENPVSLLRRAGYIFQRKEGDSSSPRGEEMSFIRPLAQSGYPRFHLFAKVEGIGLVASVHLDQKKETYGNATRHHGEYEDEGALKEEVARIMAAIS